MGINRWSDIEERKRNETDAKAGEELPAENKGDASDLTKHEVTPHSFGRASTRPTLGIDASSRSITQVQKCKEQQICG